VDTLVCDGLKGLPEVAPAGSCTSNVASLHGLDVCNQSFWQHFSTVGMARIGMRSIVIATRSFAALILPVVWAAFDDLVDR